MMSVDRAGLVMSRRFSGVLQKIAAARGTEAVLLATARAAQELVHATGLCAIPSDESHGLVAMAEDSAVTLLEADSSLQRFVTSVAQGNEASMQHRPPLEVPLLAGRPLNVETLLTVPLGADSGYVGFAFFWGQGAVPSAEQLALLPGLAWTSCLALRSQRDADALKQVRAEQRAQISEIQHRARNVLAVVRSIIRRSGNTAESPDEFASHIEGRIGALARTQGALIVDAMHGPELEDLIRTELTANAVGDTQLSITGPSLRLVPRAAETMGSWIESNVPVAQTAPQRRGFGRELIESVLPYEFGAATRFSLEASGLRCEIDLPINERTIGTADSNGGGRRL
jgi:two-component sensor histidine kinase